MNASAQVQPDSEFIDGVMRAGGGDLKKCFQCATCCSVCELASEERSFPRPQVAKAQWGMKDRLLQDPAVWLCHNCGDCTDRCPRGARPGDIMGAIRREIIKSLAFPRFMGGLTNGAAGTWTLLGISLLVIALIGAIPLRADASRSLEFAFLFPQGRLEALFFTVAALVTLAFSVGAVRLLRALRAGGAASPLLPSLVPVLGEVATHRRFAHCGHNKARLAAHMLVLFGFVGLALIGTAVGMGTLAGALHTPLPLLSPFKILANVFAALMLVGVIAVLADRIGDRELRRASTYFDWFLPVMLALVVITGIASELLRLRQSEDWMFTVYYVHLALILSLFLSAPYSKFAHFLYRTIAMAATWQGRATSTQAKFLPAAAAPQS